MGHIGRRRVVGFVDLPAIFRGLLDTISKIFVQLPHAEVTNPERMIDFVTWIAAMEKVEGVPAGVYQSAYSEALQEAQLDSLLDNPLAAAVLQLAQEIDEHDWWSGTPAELLGKLNQLATTGTQRSREWPANVIALSKRLVSLQGGLLTQGIDINLSRGKHRKVTITKLGGSDHD